MPGLTEVKAGHIISYLASYPDTLLDAAQESAPAEKESALQAGDCTLAAVRFLTGTTRFLLGAQSVELRPRLTRELERMTGLAGRVAESSAGLNMRDRERAQRRLTRALEEIRPAARGRELTRKAQGELADTLAVLADKLSAVCEGREGDTSG